MEIKEIYCWKNRERENSHPHSGAVLEAGGDCVRAGGVSAPDTGELPIAGDRLHRLLGEAGADILQTGDGIYKVAFEGVAGGDVVVEQRIGLGLVGTIGPAAIGGVLEAGRGIVGLLEQDGIVGAELQTVGKAMIHRDGQHVRGDPAAGQHHIDTAVAAVSAHHVRGDRGSAGKRTGNGRVLVLG